MFAPLLAVGEVANADGRRFIEAAVVAYEIFCRLADAVNLRERGYDYVIFKAIAAAAASAKLLGLSTEQTREAVSLAASANVALFQTRLGDVSMWKGCASANACRNAVFAARLAALGMTGPAQVFEGEAGFFRSVSGATFDLDLTADSYRCRETSPQALPTRLSRPDSVGGGVGSSEQSPARSRHRISPRRDLPPRYRNHGRRRPEVGPEGPRDGGPQHPLRRRRRADLRGGRRGAFRRAPPSATRKSARPSRRSA